MQLSASTGAASASSIAALEYGIVPPSPKYLDELQADAAIWPEHPIARAVGRSMVG